jgi:hypothetical protein
MAAASVWEKKLIHAFFGPLTVIATSKKPQCYRFDRELALSLVRQAFFLLADHHCPVKASVLKIWPTTWLLSRNLALSLAWGAFLRPLTITATSKPHSVTSFKYVSVFLILTPASKPWRVSHLTRVLGLPQPNFCLKASPFNSSLTRSQRLRHNVSFANNPTVRKNWRVWEIAIIAECERSGQRKSLPITQHLFVLSIIFFTPKLLFTFVLLWFFRILFTIS